MIQRRAEGEAQRRATCKHTEALRPAHTELSFPAAPLLTCSLLPDLRWAWPADDDFRTTFCVSDCERAEAMRASPSWSRPRSELLPAALLCDWTPTSDTARRWGYGCSLGDPSQQKSATYFTFRNRNACHTRSFTRCVFYILSSILFGSKRELAFNLLKH